MCVLTLVAPGVAWAQHPVSTSRAVPSEREEIHYLGKVNVNEASAEELERVPGLSKADIDRIKQAREKAPITNLKSLRLPARALRYLRTEGASDFARIKKLPLQAVESSPEQSGALVDNDFNS